MFRRLPFIAIVGQLLAALCLCLLAPDLVTAPASAEQRANVKQVARPSVDPATSRQLAERRATLFQRMLAAPDDLDTAFEYAALSTQLGDIEGAISTLERMLIFAPGLPRLQLELGLLYYRIRAFDNARLHLNGALQAPNVPPNVRVRVEQILANLEAAEKRDTFNAQVRFGLRYQTNANRAPDGSDISLNGRIFTLNDESLASEDWNAYAAGTANFSHDLESQGDTFDVDVIAYGSRQRNHDELNIAQAEVTAGFGLDMGRFDIDNAVLGIYGIASGLMLAEEFYSGAIGVGTRFVIQPNPVTNVLIKAEYRYRNFNKTENAQTADDRDGNEYRLEGRLSHVVSPNWLVTVGLQGQATTAQKDFLAYRQGTATLGVTHSFVPPVMDLEKTWLATAAIGTTVRNYIDNDPIFSLTDKQSDRELFVRGSLTIPGPADGWSWLLESEYRDVASNYDIRVHDNLSASVSIVKRW